MYWEQKVEYAALSDIGFRRRNNQDSYAVQIAGDRGQWESRGHVFLVADGMGGHAVGELASKIAADTIPHTYHKLTAEGAEEALRAAVETGNATIHARGELNRDFTKMGTTCTTLVLHPRGAILAHVGDSRAYRVRGERIEQLTFDHSLQWELLRLGKMSPEEIFRREPRNVITRSLGPSANVQVDIEGPFPTRGNDTYVLCSDGLSTMVSDEEIGTIVRELPPTDACRFLIDLSNLRGGPDNITAVVVRVSPIPPEFPQEPDVDMPHHGSGRLGLGWLLGAFVVMSGYIVAKALPLFDKRAEGVIVEVISILMFIGLATAWLRSRKRAAERAELPKVTPGTPYRTASAMLSPKFVTELASLEYNLQRSAVEEGWPIDWTEHQTVFQAAKAALAERRFREALRGFSRSIQILMDGIQLLRRQRDQILRWGSRPAPPKNRDEPSAGQ